MRVAKEMERRCKRDGAVWYVPLKEAKERPPNGMEMFGAKLRATGDRLSPSNKRSGGELHLSNLERARERVRNNSSCPQCGSTSFTERKVKI